MKQNGKTKKTEFHPFVKDETIRRRCNRYALLPANTSRFPCYYYSIYLQSSTSEASELFQSANDNMEERNSQ